MQAVLRSRSRLTPVLRQNALRARVFSNFAAHDTFARRHIGPTSEADVSHMLEVIGVDSLKTLVEKTVPANILYSEPPASGAAQGESDCIATFKEMMDKNKVFRSQIGTGFYDTIVPPVILRNILENPGWYTPYTPYQAEISQGRLEMLLNYQTMVMDLTGMTVANASLLCEGTAAAEAMTMVHKGKKTTFLVADDVHVHTLAVINTRAEAAGINVKVMPASEFTYDKDTFGCLVQYPTTFGTVNDYTALVEEAHANKVKVVVGSDLLALTQLTPPGEWGADVVYGNSQRFGVPLGYGGPHAAFFATNEAHKRKMPGRVIGVSRDSRGKPALRMAMQTREQHIRRDMATSNICTAQALLANTAAAYSIYHGPEGLKEIARKVMLAAQTFAAGVEQCGLSVASKSIFDTVHIPVDGNAQAIVDACAAKQINIRMHDANNVTVAFDEKVKVEHINELVECFASVTGKGSGFDAESVSANVGTGLDAKHVRASAFMTHPVFNVNHSETDMLRYLYTLQKKDLGLQDAMIPLGSCTMKLNATSEMIPVTWSTVGGLHPFAPKDQADGYKEMLTSLNKDLSSITGFHTMSLQPNAGSQGELTGLLSIRAYHRSRGDDNRNICIIPVSAHGTNPASAAMCGMKIVVVGCDEKGNINWDELKEKVEEHKDNLSALMVTYPSTHGVFETNIKEVCALIHDNGGLVYMDGANMNAQVGLCSPGDIGADVCHLNLHKTFCIPHGGGGPGMGPIGVVERLAPFLPNHPLDLECGGEQAMGAVASAPYSSASILPITWMYLNMMGPDGLKNATEMAIANANYMAKRLEGHFDILYTGENGMCAHEFILDLRPLKATAGIVEEDVAKRLMDFNLHAPTMSWPVGGTLMVEPTESEPLSELDRFCDAMIVIREEIREIETGAMSKEDNPLKNAPHTADVVLANEWNHPYTREKAAYPQDYLRDSKFWPTVTRLDNVYGDRNVVCSCPPLESYQ